jgi:P4 family phage/plasmid primase-like protien
MAAVPAEDEYDNFPPVEDEPALPERFSEDHLAQHWVKRHGLNWRYVAQWDQWLRWAGDHWEQERKKGAIELARNVTREALMWDKISPAARLRVNSAKTAHALLTFVRSDTKIAAVPEQFDTNPYLLGVPNGQIDLETCKYIEAEREAYITKQCSVTPRREIPARWLDFLAQVTAGNADIVSYLQRFSGYCLSGDTSEHALAFLYGTGANGKTTFVQCLLGILGNYALTAPIETFAETRSERHSTELARLRGARLVATEETGTGTRWNESRIKTLTGGNRIAAHFMRQDDFEFQPEFKLLIAGNHKPSMRSVDEAMKRRMHIVPFTVTIPEEDRDKHLGDKLRVEWPQILNWMIEGHAAWKDYGLAPPEDIRNATEKYLNSEDILGQWIEDCTITSGEFVRSRELYDSFTQWCDSQGEQPWKQKTFSSRLMDKGFQDDRTMHGRGFRGLKLKMSQQSVMPHSRKFNDLD